MYNFHHFYGLEFHFSYIFKLVSLDLCVIFILLNLLELERLGDYDCWVLEQDNDSARLKPTEVASLTLSSETGRLELENDNLRHIERVAIVIIFLSGLRRMTLGIIFSSRLRIVHVLSCHSWIGLVNLNI